MTTQGIFMKLTINVPDEMAEDVSAWEDGADYSIKVTQTSDGQFNLVEAAAAEPSVEDETVVEEIESPESIDAAAAMFTKED